MRFFDEESQAEIERVEKWEYYLARLMLIMLTSNGVTNVTEESLLLHFKAGSKKTLNSEKPVTKEERIKEASNFWKAFFTVQGSMKKDALKPVKKRKR